MSDQVNGVRLSDFLDDPTLEAIINVFRNRYDSSADLHKALVAVLEPQKESLLAKGADHEFLAYAIEAHMLMSAAPGREVGMRVRVFDGAGENLIGEGTYEGEVTVYYIQHAAGHLTSMRNAEEEPPDDMVPPGARVVSSLNNPKIRLDSGDVVYGCQVWWEPI